MGRPTKCNDELIAAIEKRVLDGAPIHLAARAEGVPSSTHSDWMEWGEQGKKPYCDYSETVLRARAEFACEMTKDLKGALTGGGQNATNVNAGARQWMLERGFPDEFGKAIELRVRGDVTRQVLDRLREGLDPAAFQEVARLLAGADSE